MILRRGMWSLAVSLLAAVVCAAEPSWLDTKVNVKIKHARVSTFLDTISTQAKVNFILTEGTEDKRVTAFLQDVTVREALNVLVQEQGLAYVQLGKSNTYIVAPKGSPALSESLDIPADKALEQKVSVRVKNADIGQFFETISAQTKLNFVLDESLKDAKITAFLQNVTVREALEVVMRLKGLTLKPLADPKAFRMSR